MGADTMQVLSLSMIIVHEGLIIEIGCRRSTFALYFLAIVLTSFLDENSQQD